MAVEGARAFEDGGDALAAADALRGQRIALAFALQQRGRLAGDARASGTERMTERDGAAVEIGLAFVDAELAHAGDGLGREGLVDLDDIDILDGEAGTLQRLLRRRHGADAHDVRRAA